MRIEQVPCRECRRPVARAAGLPGQPDEWRRHVVCSDCREENPEADWAALVAGNAHDRLTDRIRRFDAAAGYEYADLSHPEAARTRWAAAAREALDECDEGGAARRGVMFVGPTGIGKTYAAFAVCNAASRRLGADGVRFATEEALLGGDVSPWERTQHFGRFLRNAHTVLIDDIGVASRRSEQIQSAWKELCGLIAAQPGPMLVLGTTNRQGWDGDQGITAWLGAQSASRLRQWTIEATTGWTDRRTGAVHARWRSVVAG